MDNTTISETVLKGSANHHQASEPTVTLAVPRKSKIATAAAERWRVIRKHRSCSWASRQR